MLCLRASPRLKDAQLPASECIDLYVELVLMVRKIFHECKLVHADLSEYNILYHEGHLWIIDVSQSVEQDHPSAFDFLRNDIKNVEEFFGRLGVKGLGLRRCFEFVTKEKLFSDGGVEVVSDEEILRKWMDEVVDEPAEGDNTEEESLTTALAAHEDSVFLKSFIPRSLNEVYDPERDVAKLNRGEGQGLIYADTIGLVTPTLEAKGDTADTSKIKVRFEDAEAVHESGPSDSEEDSGSEDEDEDEEEDGDESKEAHEERKPRGHRHEDREAKKVRSKLPSPS